MVSADDALVSVNLTAELDTESAVAEPAEVDVAAGL